MIEFATYVGGKWNLSDNVAETICKHYENNDSLYFITDYVPVVATQVEFDTVAEIYSFLDIQKNLSSYRDKTRNILKKAELLDDDAEYNIELSISEAELDDIAIAHRTSVRTRGVKAAAKGLNELADTIDEQSAEGNLEELLNSYVGKDDTLKTTDDVRAGVVDILSERYGYDEGARIMVREFVEDEGFIELSFKKKIKKYDAFRDVQTQLSDLTDADILLLREGENKKDIKVKVNAQLFQIHDLMTDEFVDNSDCIGIDIINDAFDDAWSRLLQPMVEESVKDHLITDAENRVSREVSTDLMSLVNGFVSSGKQTILVVAAHSEKELELVIVDNNGQLLRGTKEKIRDFGRSFVSARMKQLIEQYRPNQVAVLKNKLFTEVSDITSMTVASLTTKPEVTTIAGTTKISSLLKSEFLKASAEQLDEATLKTYAFGIVRVMPLQLLNEIGCASFNIHPKQNLLGDEKMGEIVHKLYIAASLRRGVELGKEQDKLLLEAGVTAEGLELMRQGRKANHIKAKLDIRSNEKVSTADYNNAAGYVVFPSSSFVLDKSTVHPEEFSIVESISAELNISIDDLARDSAKVDEFHVEDVDVKRFVNEKIAEQLKVAKRFISLSSRPKRKLKLNEIRVDSIHEGRVSNIAKFGVFIDINAMSDGLVHISELTNEYVESAEQVVKVGDKVKVKVIEVNRKQRRISLSMKQADNSSLQVKASRTQLDDLASFFNKK